MNDSSWQPHCPVGVAAQTERITLAHGEGGRAMRQLIHDRIVPRLCNGNLSDANDAAALPAINGPVAFTTDSFVVSPLFFPGGDIGTLAVYGTVNDLVVAGARPRWLSLSFILEEGLPLDVFDRVVESVAAAARRANVEVVTGDTKVVPRGAADGLFITTSGIGELVSPIPAGPRSLQAGDELIVSGPIGRHGVAILACRENLGFEPAPISDCAPLQEVADALRAAEIPLRAMRDATRGGVAAVLHEWAAQCDLTMRVDETALPVSADVRGICELLGLDPLHVANEGTMVIAVPPGASESAVAALRQVSLSKEAARIGAIQPRGIAPVTIRRSLGVEHPLDEPQGAPLPRIC
jgi:hydrogenase expression/formation protein HypE